MHAEREQGSGAERLRIRYKKVLSQARMKRISRLPVWTPFADVAGTTLEVTAAEGAVGFHVSDHVRWR